MTKQDIETRKMELLKKYEDALANANALRGALQDCDFWLGRLASAEAEEADAAEALHAADVAYAEDPLSPHLVEDQ